MFRRAITILILCLLPVAAASAQSAEQINRFDVVVRLTEDNVVAVTETIAYDFGSNDRRGIFRDIPNTFINSDGQGFTYKVNIEKIQRNRSNETYQVETINEVERIRIGRADTYIRGVHEYTIVYTLRPVVFQSDTTPTQDIFRFDAVGSGWSVPIKSTSVTVAGPRAVADSACYVGPFRSGNQNCTTQATQNNTVLTFTSDQELNPGDGFTVDLGYGPGTFTEYPTFAPILFGGTVPTFFWWILGGIASVVGGIVSGFLYYNTRYRRRRKQETIIPQYEPPEGFTPGEVGLLVDHMADTVEFTATLIDLAIRGYIRIEEVKEPRWWRKGEYKLVWVDKQKKMKAYERKLLNTLMGTGDEVELKKLEQSKLRSAVSELEEALTKRLATKGYYRETTDEMKYFKKKGTWLGIGFVILASIFTFVGIIGGVIILAYFAWYGGARLYRRLTPLGYSGWAHVEGFKDFLSTTEKDRLKFHDAPQASPEQFRELLPYAVALGVEKEWTKQFENIGIADQQGDWYTSRSGILPVQAISGITSGLSSQVQSTYSAGSSGGVGGGFSGGGVGGGGGGSW